jgi:hypothetical protein
MRREPLAVSAPGNNQQEVSEQWTSSR